MLSKKTCLISASICLSIFLSACSIENVPATSQPGDRNENFASVSNDTSTSVNKISDDDIVPKREDTNFENYDNSDDDIITTELTLSELQYLYNSETFVKDMKNTKIDYFDKYWNVYEDEEVDDMLLTSRRYCNFENEGKDFVLDIYYWKEGTSISIGHSGLSIDSISLRNVETTESIVLFLSESREKIENDIEAFVGKIPSIEDSLSFELPVIENIGESIALGSFKADVFFDFSGSVFESSKFETMPHSNEFPASWYALGGIGRMAVNPDDDRFLFEDNVLKDVSIWGNHFSCETVKNFAVNDYTGICQLFRFDAFPVSEVETDEFEESKMFVCFFARGQGSDIYCIFFNANVYDADECVEYLNSVKIK